MFGKQFVTGRFLRLGMGLTASRAVESIDLKYNFGLACSSFSYESCIRGITGRLTTNFSIDIFTLRVVFLIAPVSIPYISLNYRCCGDED